MANGQNANNDDGRNLLSELWHEIRPAVKHALATLVLIGLVLGVGLAAKGVKKLLGDEANSFCHFLEMIDGWMGIGTLCFFGLVMFISLTEMAWTVLSEEW